MGNEQPQQKRVHSRRPDVVDEHYYSSVPDFLRDASRFDRYDRKGSEIFVGEWAAYETPFVPWDSRSLKEAPTPNLKAAIGDAAWMAGMERNSDIIKLNCYAPLLVNVNGRQWRPNLIGYDALSVYGSPSYYAIKMFSTDVGDEILPAKLDSRVLHYSVTRDTKHDVILIKLVNPQSEPEWLKIRLMGVHSVGNTGKATVLEALPDATNSLEDPTHVKPVESNLTGLRPAFGYGLPASSVVVLKIKAH